MSRPVKVFVTNPRGSSFQFLTMVEAAKFLAGKIWSDRAKGFYTEQSVRNLLDRRIDEIEGYKFEYQE